MKDKMDKYLQKTPKYTPVDTIDNVFAKSLDKAGKDQKKKSKKVAKMLIRDDEQGIRMVESEDGVMTYFTGQGNYHQAIRYGSRPGLSRRTRQHNLQFAREILEAEGMLTQDIDEGIKRGMLELKDDSIGSTTCCNAKVTTNEATGEKVCSCCKARVR